MRNILSRFFSLVLVAATILSMLVIPSQAASINDNGSATAKLTVLYRNTFLYNSYGVGIQARYRNYVTNDGIEGPGYCVEHGQNEPGGYYPNYGSPMQIAGLYSNPHTMGAFANGYPQRSLADFKDINLAENPILSGLTEEEYAYATQLAIWATMGQLAVEGTFFTSGAETLKVQSSGDQNVRIYTAIKIILYNAGFWSQPLLTGMSARPEDDKTENVLKIPTKDYDLETLAAQSSYGLSLETINGTEYITRRFVVSSATSVYPNGRKIDVWLEGAPTGTILVNMSNQPFSTTVEAGITKHSVPAPNNRDTGTNSNGAEYWGEIKICIPADSVPDTGDITINISAAVTQYLIYYLKKPALYYQDCVIADPSTTNLDAQGFMIWSTEESEVPPPGGGSTPGTLVITKTDGTYNPLAGISFTLSGSDGSSVTATTDGSGRATWSNLNPSVSYTLYENAAPEGYELMEPKSISISSGQTSYITVQNTLDKKLTIKKVDAQNGGSLAGAVFEFRQIDGSHVTTATTLGDGTIVFAGDSLPYGSYQVKELTAPAGYEPDSTAQTVNWTGAANITLTFKNVRKPTIRLYKVDEDTNTPLAGVSFRVYKDGRMVATVTTNDAGIAYVNNATEGYWEFEEVAAPHGYLYDGTRHGIYIDPYDPATTADPYIVVTNKARPSLTILKFDRSTMAPMADVVFEVYRDAVLIGTFTTDTNGRIALPNLEPGTYTAIEVGGPSSHVINSTPQSIEVRAGESARLIFLNDLKPGIHIVKLDSETLRPLPNAVFVIKKVGDSYQKEFTSGANGEIDLTELDPGTYTVTEKSAPNGYLLDDSTRTIQINPGENGIFVFTNTPKPSLVVMKYDPITEKYLPGATFKIARIADGSHYLDRVTDTNGRIEITNLEPGVYSIVEIAAPAGYVLNSHEYHVELFPGEESQIVVVNEKKPDLRIIKTDAVTGSPVAGVAFTVNKTDSSTLTTVTTDSKGECLLVGLDPGVYTVREQSVPAGYLIDETPQNITLVPNETGIVQFQNYPKPGLTVRKIDAATGDPIKGAKFSIVYAKSNTASGELISLGTFYTDDNGIIHLSELQDGWYQITEIEPAAGFIIRGEAKQTIFIKAGESKTVTFENVRQGQIIIQKLDADDRTTPIEGVEFEIRKINGEYVGKFITNSSGLIAAALEDGWYEAVETYVKAPYILDPTPHKFQVKGGKIEELRIYNKQMSGLIIHKTDSITGKGIYGVTFVLYDSSMTPIMQLVSDQNGYVWVERELPSGRYYLREIEPAEGYVADNQLKTVYFEAGKTSTVEWKNKPILAQIQVIKYSSDYNTVTGTKAGTLLAGAVFEITRYKSGQVVGYITTDARGVAASEPLPLGRYIVREVTAPPYYELSDEKHCQRQSKNAQKGSLNFAQ